MVSFRPTQKRLAGRDGRGLRNELGLDEISVWRCRVSREGTADRHQQQNEQGRESARIPQRRPGNLQGCSPSRMSHENNMLGHAAARQVTTAHNSVIPIRLPSFAIMGRPSGCACCPHRGAHRGEGICQLRPARRSSMPRAGPQGYVLLFNRCNLGLSLLIWRDILRFRRKQFYLQPSARALFRTVSTPPPPVRDGRGLLVHGWHITAGA